MIDKLRKDSKKVDDKNQENTDPNEMTFDMEDVERLGDEMEEISQNKQTPIDNDNYGADFEDTKSRILHKKSEN